MLTKLVAVGHSVKMKSKASLIACFLIEQQRTPVVSCMALDRYSAEHGRFGKKTWNLQRRGHEQKERLHVMAWTVGG